VSRLTRDAFIDEGTEWAQKMRTRGSARWRESGYQMLAMMKTAKTGILSDRLAL
jgi:hypothetical protein